LVAPFVDERGAVRFDRADDKAMLGAPDAIDPDVALMNRGRLDDGWLLGARSRRHLTRGLAPSAQLRSGFNLLPGAPGGEKCAKGEDRGPHSRGRAIADQPEHIHRQILISPRARWTKSRS